MEKFPPDTRFSRTKRGKMISPYLSHSCSLSLSLTLAHYLTLSYTWSHSLSFTVFNRLRYATTFIAAKSWKKIPEEIIRNGNCGDSNSERLGEKSLRFRILEMRNCVKIIVGTTLLMSFGTYDFQCDQIGRLIVIWAIILSQRCQHLWLKLPNKR